MHTRSALHPARVAIRLPNGKPSFGIRWKLSVPRPTVTTPSAGPAGPVGLTARQRKGAEEIASRADRDGLLKVHGRREDSPDPRERELAVIAGEELLNRADSRRDSLGSAVSRLLEADPGLTVHAAIVQAILEEEPDGLREWTPAAPHEWQRRY